MPTASGLSIRPEGGGRIASQTRSKVLILGLSFYAASTLISMAVMSIGAAVAGAAILYAVGPRVLCASIAELWRLPRVRRYGWASIALLGACAVSLIAAAIVPVGWGGWHVEPSIADMAKSWYFAWPLVLAVGLTEAGEGGRRKVLTTWLLTFAALSALGVVQHYIGWPRAQFIPNSPQYFHATLFLGHHLSVASVFIFPFFATLEFLRLSRDGECSPSPLRCRVLVGIAVLGFATLILTYSRMLWLALPVGIVLWAIRFATPKQRIGTIVAAVSLLGAASMTDFVRSRMSDMIGVGDRQQLWLANLEFLRLRPLTGTGFRLNDGASYKYLEMLANGGRFFSGHGHNNLIDMLGGTGLLGAAAWLLWCCVMFGLLWPSSKDRARDTFAWGIFCAWVVFQLNGLTQVNFWEGKVMHQMMWAVAWSIFWICPSDAGAKIGTEPA